MGKYRHNIYEDVIEYYKENFYEDIDEDDVDKMERDDVLKYWLEWNGIIGYTYDIVNIIEANEDLYTKQNVIDNLKDYIDVLKMDASKEQNYKCKCILNNVIRSLNDIAENFKD